MFQETSPENLSGLINIPARSDSTNEPGDIGWGRLDAQSPPPQPRRVSESSESIAELVQCGYNTDDGCEPDQVVPVPIVEERRLFTTPCGQTYWIDDELSLYTNRNVQHPIGCWCSNLQAVILRSYFDEDTDDDDDDEYDEIPLSPSPPRYTETPSISPENNSSDFSESE